MKTNYIYVIVDKLSGQTSPLFVVPNDSVARRQFGTFLQGVTDVPSSDYDLYQLGRWDADALKIEPNDSAKHLFNGAALRPSMASEDYHGE